MSTVNDYLPVKEAALAALRAKLAEPGAAPNKLRATARVAGASGVRPVSIREFTIVTDSGPALAGYNLGPTAPELLLASLASCLAHTFLITAATHGVPLSSLEVEVSGTIDFRGVLEVDPAIPSRPEGLRYEARIGGDASAEQLALLHREVERLCPVLRALAEPLVIAGVVTGESV